MAVDLDRLKVGDIVTIKSGAKDYTGVAYKPWVYGYEFTVIQVGTSTIKDYIVFGIDGVVTGSVTSNEIETVKYKNPAKAKVQKSSPPKPKVVKEPKVEKVNIPTDPISDNNSNAGISSKSNTGVVRDGAFLASKEEPDARYSGGNNPSENSTDYKKRFALTPNVNIPTDKYIGTLPGSPSLITTSAHWPKVSVSTRKSADGKTQYKKYTYDYTINPDTDEYLKSRLEHIHEKSNISVSSSRMNMYKSATHLYNRFKIANPNTQLIRSFAHVFFTRPDLNILLRKGANTFSLASSCKNSTAIHYAYNSNPELLKELTLDNGMNHKFLFSLSSAAKSFQLANEPIKTATYGDTWTGHKIAYGKHDTEGKIAGQFQIQYTDNRNLNIYLLHKIWTDYISKVYRGEFISKGQVYIPSTDSWSDPVMTLNGGSTSYIENKILDYACSVYYILTAENGEDIIFWSKYYGVFPTDTSSNTFSWTSGSMLSTPQLDITYQYSFKQDFDPYNLVEFNHLSPIESPYKYIPKYDVEALGTGRTMVGAPYIETVINPDNPDEPYVFKLRFRPPTDIGKKGPDYTSYNKKGS